MIAKRVVETSIQIREHLVGEHTQVQVVIIRLVIQFFIIGLLEFSDRFLEYVSRFRHSIFGELNNHRTVSIQPISS